MDNINISYHLSPINDSKDGTEVFDFELDGSTFDLIASDSTTPPEWAELSYRQCSHCPLDSSEHKYCPIAANMHQIIDRFHGTRSIDEIELQVTTPERRIIQETDLQHAIASMLNLIIPSCGCPKTAHMKPLVRFHLPMASEEESILQITSMYLLGQYLSNDNEAGTADFSGLADIYADMNILNKSVASRLQLATQSDSCKNAITLLDMYSTLIPVLLEDRLDEMRPFFQAVLSDDRPTSTSNHIEKAKALVLELAPLDNDPAEEPQWMKDSKQTHGSEADNTELSLAAANDDTSATDKILASSGLSLALEPIDNSASGSAAVFTLPDD